MSVTPDTYWLAKLVDSSTVDELVRLNLISDYASSGDWYIRDALRKVIKYYSSPQQYEAFEEVVDEQS
jgi:hypothetical protein